MPKIRDLKKRLEEYDDDTPCAYALWLPEDVREQVAAWLHEISDEDVETTLDTMHRRHDATIGMNWDVLEACVPDHLE